MNEFKKHLGPNFEFEVQPRRPGDLVTSYGDAGEAKKILGWSAAKTLSDMVASVIPAKVN